MGLLLNTMTVCFASTCYLDIIYSGFILDGCLENIRDDRTYVGEVFGRLNFGCLV